MVRLAPQSNYMRGAAVDQAKATEHCPYGFSLGGPGSVVIDMTGDDGDRRGEMKSLSDVRDVDDERPRPLPKVIDYDDGGYRSLPGWRQCHDNPVFGECSAEGVLFDLGLKGEWSKWPGTCPVCGAENDCSDEANGGDC